MLEARWFVRAELGLSQRRREEVHPSASCPSCPTPPRVRLLQVGPHRHVSLLGARPPRTRPSVMSQAPGRGSSVSCWDRRASEPGQVPPVLAPPATRCVCSGSSRPLSEPAFWPPDGNMGSDAPGCRVELRSLLPRTPRPSSGLRVSPCSLSRPLDLPSAVCDTA